MEDLRGGRSLIEAIDELITVMITTLATDEGTSPEPAVRIVRNVIDARLEAKNVANAFQDLLQHLVRHPRRIDNAVHQIPQMHFLSDQDKGRCRILAQSRGDEMAIVKPIRPKALRIDDTYRRSPQSKRTMTSPRVAGLQSSEGLPVESGTSLESRNPTHVASDSMAVSSDLNARCFHPIG